MNKPLIVGVLSLSALAAPPARADLISIGAIKDNTLYESLSGDTSNGAGQHIFIGATGGFGARRGVLAFDVAAAVPAGATVNSASLKMNLSRCGPSCFTNIQMDLQRMLADWGEGASDAGPLGGNGVQAQPGDATWLNTFYSTSFWASPGGDYDGSTSASATVSGLGFYTWASTANFVADVQGMLDNPASNFGWGVIGDESLAGTAKRFDSRENAIASLRPVLTIDYTPIPEPGTLFFIAIGAVALHRSRRRRMA